MPEFKVHHLWPIPVYAGTIKTKKEWQDSITKLEYVRTHIGNSDISVDRDVIKKMPDLKEEVDRHIFNFTKKYLKVRKGLDFYMLNSWVNIHHPGDVAQIHHHSNSLISGVYYPIVPHTSGDLQLHRSTHKNLFDQCITMEYDDHFNVNSDRYTLDTFTDLIVLFPSHLEHGTQENISNKKRYSIAFNYYVKGVLGKEEYRLEFK